MPAAGVGFTPPTSTKAAPWPVPTAGHTRLLKGTQAGPTIFTPLYFLSGENAHVGTAAPSGEVQSSHLYSSTYHLRLMRMIARFGKLSVNISLVPLASCFPDRRV